MATKETKGTKINGLTGPAGIEEGILARMLGMTTRPEYATRGQSGAKPPLGTLVETARTKLATPIPGADATLRSLSDYRDAIDAARKSVANVAKIAIVREFRRAFALASDSDAVTVGTFLGTLSDRIADKLHKADCVLYTVGSQWNAVTKETEYHRYMIARIRRARVTEGVTKSEGWVVAPGFDRQVAAGSSVIEALIDCATKWNAGYSADPAQRVCNVVSTERWKAGEDFPDALRGIREAQSKSKSKSESESENAPADATVESL